MSDETPKQSPTHTIERHLQTLMLTVVSALLIWNWSSTQGAQVELASLRAQTELLRADVNKLQVSVERSADERYTAAQAAVDKAAHDQAIQRLEARVRDLEKAR